MPRTSSHETTGGRPGAVDSARAPGGGAGVCAAGSSGRKGHQGEILDQVVQLCGWNRRYAMRALGKAA